MRDSVPNRARVVFSCNRFNVHKYFQHSEDIFGFQIRRPRVDRPAVHRKFDTRFDTTCRRHHFGFSIFFFFHLIIGYNNKPVLPNCLNPDSIDRCYQVITAFIDTNLHCAIPGSIPPLLLFYITTIILRTRWTLGFS